VREPSKDPPKRVRDTWRLSEQNMKKRPLSKHLLQRSRGLRKSATDAENRLWSHLRDRRLLGFKFRRQQVLGTFVLDFYCDEAKLAVEVDGGQHAERNVSSYDSERTELLRAKGVTVLRFWNNEVLQNLEGVLKVISDSLCSLTPTLSQWEREPEAENLRPHGTPETGNAGGEQDGSER
jgi:very-short-patch-repair endonuclease